LNESGAHRIIANMEPLLVIRLFRSNNVIEEALLPQCGPGKVAAIAAGREVVDWIFREKPSKACRTAILSSNTSSIQKERAVIDRAYKLAARRS
jgi:hypothetical protein